MITKQTIYKIDDNVNMNNLNGNQTSNRQPNLYSKAPKSRTKWQLLRTCNLYYIQTHAMHWHLTLDNHKVGKTIKATENGAYYPRVTERTIMRISAIKIPNTISFTFMFCSHIFRRIEVPELLKSCAWKRKYKIICYHSIIKAIQETEKWACEFERIIILLSSGERREWEWKILQDSACH